MESALVFKNINLDVIHEILYNFVSVDQIGPFKLLEVCKTWNALVLNSPRLWTWIHIDDSILGWEERLTISFHRSKQLPLHVILDLPLASALVVAGTQDAQRSIALLSESLSLSRWCTLEVDMSDQIDDEEAHSFVKELLGNPPPTNLRSLRWFCRGVEISRPLTKLMSHQHLFRECFVNYRSQLNHKYLNKTNFPFLTCLDLTFIDDTPEFNNLSLPDFLLSLRQLPYLRDMRLKSTLINWDKDLQPDKTTLPKLKAITFDICRRDFAINYDIGTSSSEPPFQSLTSSALATFLSRVAAPALCNITIYGIAGDIYQSLHQLRQFPCLKRLSLVVRRWEPALNTWINLPFVEPMPIHSLEELSLNLEADHAPNFRSDHAREFLHKLFGVATDIASLSVSIYSVEMVKLLKDLLPQLGQLLIIEWKRGYSVSGWRKDDPSIIHPDLPILSQVHKIVVNSYSDFDWFPFLCPQARQIVANGWDYTKPSASTFAIPNAERLQELDLGLLDIRPGLKGRIRSQVQFTHLKSLRCNISVLLYFPIDSALCLQHLALLPFSEEENTIDELPPEVVSILMQASRIERLELFASRVVYDGKVQTMVDVYLAALYGRLKKRQCSLSKGRDKKSIGPSFFLRILETQCYPDWFIFLDVVKLLYSTHFPNPLQALYLPGRPHPLIRQAIVSAFRDEFTDTYPSLKPGTGCQYCVDSGWICTQPGKEDEFDMCGRHSTTSLVALSSYTL